MIIVRIWEGLGNQMFQYAYARKRMAESVPVSLDLNRAYIEAFPTFKNNTFRCNRIQKFHLTIPSMNVEKYGRYFYMRRKTRLEKSICFLAEHRLWPYAFIEEETEHYSRKAACVKGNVYLKGWFQDQRYFEGIRKELLHEFTPRKKIRLSSDLLRMVRSRNSVAIHVRRGDYVRLGWTLSRAYYIQTKELLEKKIEAPVFFVFSDDYFWVKENIPFKETDRVFYIDEICRLEDYEQLLLMSSCRAQIISNRTFSWWAARLNTNSDKLVFMPKKDVQLNPGLEIKGSILY